MEKANPKRKTIGGDEGALTDHKTDKKPYRRNDARNYRLPVYTGHRLYEKLSETSSYSHLNLNYSLRVGKHVLQKALVEEQKSLLFSPVSSTAVLNILAVGAKGDTQEQLLGLLECENVDVVNETASSLVTLLEGLKVEGADEDEDEDEDEDAPEVVFANALWFKHNLKIKERFGDLLRDVHSTRIMSADFVNKVDELIRDANLWAEEQSKGLIKQILSKDFITANTMMILANALYFKGTWVETFKRHNTKNEDFHLLKGGTVRVPMMTQWSTDFDYGTLEECNCKILRMMYREPKSEKESQRQKSFSMYIFLPDEKDGLPKVLDNLKMDMNLFEQVKLKNQSIRKLSIPKFSFDCDFSLKKPMMELGLNLPFDQLCQELSEMVEVPNGDWPYVSDVFQKCRIEVDEEGTKAVAFTYVHLCGGGGPQFLPPPIDFVADHPFLFMIREDFSDAILFVGTMLNPVMTS